MKKVIASSVLATSVLLPTNVLVSTPLSTYAASNESVVSNQLIGNTAILTEDNVNVRKGAGTEFNSIAKVHTGQIVSILATEKNSKGETWYKVSYNSTEGWIISDYVQAATATVNNRSGSIDSSYVGTTQIIGNSASDMRSGATTSYKVVSTIPAGTSLKVVDAFTNAQKEVWFNVDYQGNKGWAKSDSFILDTPDGQVPTSAVKSSSITDGASYVGTAQVIGNSASQMRSGATTSYKVVSTIPAGTSLKVVDAFTNAQKEVWFNVEYQGKKGWVKSDLFTLNASADQTPTTAVKNSSITSGTSYVGSFQVIGKSASNMRSGATTSYKVVETIPAGTSVKILNAFTNAQKEVWFNVEYNGKKGWVTSDLFALKATAGQSATSKKVVNQMTIHKGATKSYSVVSTAKPGTTLVIHEEFTNAFKEKWMQVTYAPGKKGWILASAFEDASIENKAVLRKSTVHSGATKSYKTVATINVGTKLPIHQEFTNAAKEKWYQVTYAAGKKGWIPASAFESVSSTPGESETPPVDENNHVILDTHLKISVAVANMRSGPSLSFDVVTQAKMNDSFLSTEYAEDAAGEKWFKVITTSGDAWLHESVISVGDASVDVPNYGDSGVIQRFNALVYVDSSFSSKVLVGLPKNTSFTILNQLVADGTVWIQISTSNGQVGWVPDFEVNENIPTKYGTKTSTVYNGASATAKKVDTIYLSSPVRILRTLNGWVNIETQNQKRGWIQASVLSDVSPISLTNGRTEVRNGQDYLVWSKPSKFNISYSMPSKNVLKVSGNLSQINEIKSNVAGVDSMKVEKVSGGTSVLSITFNPNYTYTIRDYDKELTIKVVPKGLAGKKIIIDAGHGAKDPGAVGPNKTKEKDVTLSTAKALKAELEAAGAEVVLTRSTDVFLELKERTDIANKSDYDAFISIHADAFTSTSKGTTTYYNASVNFNGPKSYTLAKSVQSDLVKAIGTYNRGVKSQSFYVNRMNELPSVLVELAFISNPTEEAQLKTAKFQKNAAIGIRKGLENYFQQ
ncbi:SH3 domain-containing protein [Psychrobacillus sp. FJAT-51614]|uniref:SH3 domain-containing protein n=1 Tax=Psychrobacillus mangrovi TaxID=3117745 RepID=A0ABU8F3I5_9BACI